ncbi:MAG: hypothetical protein JST16_09785 [Bdellovibrionales bacterium]|nr:hypothetical protein [Bdellovibrionales bacterium]
MKTQIFSSLASVLVLSSLSAVAAPREVTPIEYYVNKVFAPAQGFDDNDMVQIVVDGVIPNDCYQQGRTEVDFGSRLPNDILVTQYLVRLHDGDCALDDDALPVSLQNKTPFMVPVNAGVMNKGDYFIVYQDETGIVRRPLHIDAAPVTTVDSAQYATVGFAYIADTVKTTEGKTRVEFSGTLTSSCMELDENVSVQLVGDVLVLLPQVKTVADICMPVSRPYMKEIYVDIPSTPGRYMLHVRSKNGRAVNRLFTVEN